MCKVIAILSHELIFNCALFRDKKIIIKMTTNIEYTSEVCIEWRNLTYSANVKKDIPNKRFRFFCKTKVEKINVLDNGNDVNYDLIWWFIKLGQFFYSF